MNRRTSDGKPAGGWLPEQRVSVETALRGYTSGAAYASFEETSKGTLEPGKLADLIVLSQNPFEIDPIKLHQTRVLLTLVGGEAVHDELGLLLRSR